ncbi:MAG: hypothetical protein ACPG6B_00810 [Oceanihabitans sp.]
MSDKLPNNNSTEEVDLGQIFLYIEKVFKKIGKLIEKLFLGLFWLLKKISFIVLFGINVAKKNIIKISIASIVVFVIFTVLDKKSKPVYQSSILINQNYETGRLLYNHIGRYNLIARNGDSIGLSKELNIRPEVAAKITGFDVTSSITKNQLYQEYHEFFKEVDSTIYVSFFEFEEAYPIELIKTQHITVFSLSPDVYPGLANSIVDIFKENKYFKEKQQVEIESYNNKIKIFKEIITKSDTLMQKYITLMQNYYGNTPEGPKPSNATVNLNLSNNKDKITTREYEIFNSQNSNKIEIADLQSAMETKKEIVELQSNFTQPVLVVNFYKKNKMKATLLAGFLVLLFFFFKELGFYGLIDEYGNKENVLEI